MTTPDDNDLRSAATPDAERLARSAGQAVRFVSAVRRLEAARAAGAIDEAEYRAALAALEHGESHRRPDGAA